MKRTSFVAVVILCLVSTEAMASRQRRARTQGSRSMCSGSAISSTIYNLPHQDRRETFRGFRTFEAAVRMQGSGKMRDGRIRTYTGRNVQVPASCKTTTTSASGNCLLSMFSVAADPRYHRMGDIIYIRGLADQEITLPSGRTVRHPGFFIVHDVGGAIKGPNRFDFFAGTTDVYNNSLSRFKLGDKRACNHQMTKIERGSHQYQDALAQIYQMQEDDTSRGGSGTGGGPATTLASTGR